MASSMPRTWTDLFEASYSTSGLKLEFFKPAIMEDKHGVYEADVVVKIVRRPRAYLGSLST